LPETSPQLAHWRDGTSAVSFDPLTFIERLAAWAELLQRVFAIDVLTCPHCGARRKLIALLTDPAVVRKILAHLGLPTEPHALRRPPPLPGSPCADRDGFSLHAKVLVPAGELERLEHLCRYMTRPPIATQRLALAPDGRVIYGLSWGARGSAPGRVERRALSGRGGPHTGSAGMHRSRTDEDTSRRSPDRNRACWRTAGDRDVL